MFTVEAEGPLCAHQAYYPDVPAAGSHARERMERSMPGLKWMGETPPGGEMGSLEKM